VRIAMIEQRTHHHRAHRRTAALVGVFAVAASLLPAQAAGAASAQQVTFAAARAVYTAAEGSTAPVGVTVTTSDGRPLGAPQQVRYATGAGSASAGADYTATAGALTFPAGTASGTTKTFAVAVRNDATAETAESVPVTLEASSATVSAASTAVVVNANGFAYLNPALPVSRRVADLLSRMTLEEKIGQMTQAERGAVDADRTLVAQWLLGSVLSGGGSTPTPNTPAAWVDLVNSLQAQALSTRLQIPLIYGIDAVHGHGNVYGATVFPHNMGLGATRDPGLLERIGQATAAEVRATGIHWDFAPCVCVSRDERWGRTYESLSEDPALVVKMSTIIDGLQGRRPSQLDDDDRVLATAKHYAGDGDTEYGTAAGDYQIDQGITVTNRRDFAAIDLAPYWAAVRRHDVGSVMPSFSSVDFTSDGVGNPLKMHAHRELITDVLKKRIGFDGFVISDWEGIHQIPDPAEPTNNGLTAYKVRVGVNAGTDMFMEPFSAKPFEDLLLAEVNAGRVSRARIDDAVRRILRKKFELGLFERPYTSADNLDEVGSAAHRALARQAVAESQVLLTNKRRALPLSRRGKIYVAGRNADNIGNQAGGWTITWQGFSGDAIPGTTVLEGIREVAPRAEVTYSVDGSAPTDDADVGIVVVGETPYAEGFGDVGGPRWAWDPADGGVPREPKTLTLSDGDKAVVDKVCGEIETCVVLVVSGRPQILTGVVGVADAVVASGLPGSEGAGVADVLFGRRPFTGRLSMTWPRSAAQVPINVGDASYDPLFPYGWGLRTFVGRSSGDGAAALGGDAGAYDVSVARDRAHEAVVRGDAPANWANLIAGADHALAAGDTRTALRLLRAVA
jgi:beta-glucosidase